MRARDILQSKGTLRGSVGGRHSVTQQVSREVLFQQASKKLRSDFESVATIPHNLTKGQEAERVLRDFLAGHLPKRFGVTAGFVLDPANQVSRQQDVIIYDALNCPVYLASDDAAIIPADNVAAVIEVKSALNSAQLQDGLQKIASVKALKKTVRPQDQKGPSAVQTYGGLFAYKSELTLSALCTQYAKSFDTIPLGHHTDVVAVLDQGVIHLVTKIPGVPQWNPLLHVEGISKAVEGAHIGAAAHDLGVGSLDYFFRLLLGQLSLFRQIVPHPGFGLDGSPTAMVVYVMSLTLESDPVLREDRLKEYAAQIAREYPAPL